MEFISDITVKPIQQMGGDYMVVAAAKVSTNGADALRWADPENMQDSIGIINYLMKHRHGCYSADTEVLTDEGWKLWPDVRGSEKFVTLNLATDQIEYQAAQRLVVQEEEALLHVQTEHVDQLITGTHNVLALPRIKGGQWGRPALMPAIKLLERAYRLRLGGGTWRGNEQPCLLNSYEAKLVGFFIGDGHLGKKASTPAFHLHRADKIAYLKEAAIAAGLTITGADVDPSRFLLSDCSTRLRGVLHACYTTDREKCIPRWLLGLPVHVLEGLFEGLMRSDGSTSSKGKETYSTVSSRLADDLQELALKLGRSATIRCVTHKEGSGHFGAKPVYSLCFFGARNNSPRIGWTLKARRTEVVPTPYAGKVYCVTVPNGTLYVRRNGKPCWSGNTPFEHAAMTFFVHAPIFVYREWHRHRIGVSYNEESGRYSQLKPVFYVPSPDRPMFKVDGWKPGRPKFLTIDQYASRNRSEDVWPSLPRPVPLDIDMEPERWAFDCLIENLKDDYTRSYAHYEENLAMGFDPGLARIGLPVGIYSSQWFTCNPRSLMAFVSLRVHEPEALFVSYPLWEIDVAARQCEELLKLGWPETHKAFIANKRVGP